MTDSNTRDGLRRKNILASFATPQDGLYVVGTFDVGVTVYSQQTRALNLAWALIESNIVKASKAGSTAFRARPATRIAIVGGGFAGLTTAAALIKKGAICDITLFERRDTLLPLQQGSDSRWLHPRIYDWPASGSEMATAALPVLNWTAGRASDVAVQILHDWKKIVKTTNAHNSGEPRKMPTSLSVFCNTNHLQIHGATEIGERLRVEWVGDLRRPDLDNKMESSTSVSCGTSQEFDLVILAVGFGLERDQALSYWRNETLSQPYLGQGRITYIVSGQGDGAMIDLLRIRITEFRQDRILSELFEHEKIAILELRKLLDRRNNIGPHEPLFVAFENIYTTTLCKISAALGKRLRRDTQVILHTKVKRISELFDSSVTKISFQNKLLVYLLYKCGGFIPSAADLDTLQMEFAVSPERVIRRHGTLRDDLLKEMLDPRFFSELEARRNSYPSDLTQIAQAKWSGGYFDFLGSEYDAKTAPDKVKRTWRKEYLPATTELIAGSFCATVAGYLSASPSAFDNLRVTLHRVVKVGDEELMQQSCQYRGNSSDDRMLDTAGRTFPPTHATIGLAYSTMKIVSSKLNAQKFNLRNDMKNLKLSEGSREMSSKVQSLLAIPFLCRNDDSSTAIDQRVFAILYIDSFTKGCFKPGVIMVLKAMCQSFLAEIERISAKKIDRISNYIFELKGVNDSVKISTHSALTIHDAIAAPVSKKPLALNFDHADFVII